ncbi:hypothetical protein [Conexibacter sp. SYSU D00693]|uniref:hypothetical protein n=1 Tax=Conexibacter sp. SYSU D00693 TaxID=2812560 RepID=UPI00196B1F3B|nr:hypothetical protein [Conexibacter sp. SYSU D00693]
MAGEHHDEPIDLVASAGALDPVIATLREFLHHSGAVRAVAVVDGTDEGDGPALVDVGRLLPIEVQHGTRVVHLPHAIELDAPPLGLVDVRQLPPFEVDPASGEVAATIGGVEHLARATRDLARLIGGRSVAMAQFDTTTPDLRFGVAARGDDPIVLTIGEEEFEMEPGWPDAAASEAVEEGEHGG